ncbi:MAG: nucleotide pyrophosphohydrolase [Actinomycetia bacterium]|jgi:NTP pyrophosphatase (non-canonical NTP hydrolase)|nr:nucleotide pyrophosphohydrolase [Actinomycetes bacterium]
MTLDELQAAVDAWIGQFAEGYFEPLAMVARLTEELGELAREVSHAYGPKPKKPDEPPGSVAEEAGDLLFVLASLANALGFRLEDAFLAVMEKYRRRDQHRWTPRRTDG